MILEVATAKSPVGTSCVNFFFPLTLDVHVYLGLRRPADPVGGPADVCAGVVSAHPAEVQAQALLVGAAARQQAGLLLKRGKDS